MTTTQIRQALPTGTWHLDPVHSSIGFEVAYMGGAFRGQFREVDATLADTRLTGSAKVASVDVKDENLAAHLQSPEFFDVERYPELRFERDRGRGGADDPRRDHDQGRHAPGRADRPLDRAADRRLRTRALRAHARDEARPHRVRAQLEPSAPERRAGALERGHPRGRALLREGGVTNS